MLLILSSVYLRALDGLAVEATGWSRLWKGMGVMSLVYGVLLLIGAASGAQDPLQPLQNVFAAQSSGTAVHGQHAELPFKPIKTVDDLDSQLAAATRQGSPVMVDFYADWCTSCKEMEKYTFARPEVQQALAGMVLLQADVTANDDADKALLKRFKLIGPPSILFFDASGKERKELSLVGYKPADEFVEHVQVLR
jgi:thioredoxin:protein disulfide reductase